MQHMEVSYGNTYVDAPLSSLRQRVTEIKPSRDIEMHLWLAMGLNQKSQDLAVLG